LKASSNRSLNGSVEVGSNKVSAILESEPAFTQTLGWFTIAIRKMTKT
jgi:hypothetical protein